MDFELWIMDDREACAVQGRAAVSMGIWQSPMYRFLKKLGFLIFINFAPLRLCARKLFIGIEWIGSMVLSCQRCRGVKIASRKVAKAQRKMELMVDGYALDP